MTTHFCSHCLQSKDETEMRLFPVSHYLGTRYCWFCLGTDCYSKFVDKPMRPAQLRKKLRNQQAFGK